LQHVVQIAFAKEDHVPGKIETDAVLAEDTPIKRVANDGRKKKFAARFQLARNLPDDSERVYQVLQHHHRNDRIECLIRVSLKCAFDCCCFDIKAGTSRNARG
jgi:hypothetical protein